MRRPVEAELFFKLCYEARVKPLRAPVFARPPPPSSSAPSPAKSLPPPPSRSCRNCRTDRRSPARLDRRRKLHDDERNQQDADNRRDHQKDAAEDIGSHQGPARSMARRKCVSYISSARPWLRVIRQLAHLESTRLSARGIRPIVIRAAFCRIKPPDRESRNHTWHFRRAAEPVP